jgi:hypothetical protein
MRLVGVRRSCYPGKVRFFVLVSTLFLATAFRCGQGSYGSLVGTVSDASGGRICNGKVVLPGEQFRSVGRETVAHDIYSTGR